MNDNLLEKILVSALQLSSTEREVLASRLRVAVESGGQNMNRSSSPLPEGEMASPQSLLSGSPDSSDSGGE